MSAARAETLCNQRLLELCIEILVWRRLPILTSAWRFGIRSRVFYGTTSRACATCAGWAVSQGIDGLGQVADRVCEAFDFRDGARAELAVS